MRTFIGIILSVAFFAAGRGAAAEASAPIRVLTYNIHHGEGIDQKLDLGRIAVLVKKVNADIVALQEVDRGVERTARRDLPAELAQLTGMKVYFDRNIIHQGGDYGNAVLTKFPIKQATNTHLRRVGDGEQRGVLQLVLDVGGRDLLFMNTHLDSRKAEAERLDSADTLARLANGAGEMPVIICGDFNTAPGSGTYEKMKEVLGDAWEKVGQGSGFTVPVPTPTRRIDYIWFSNDTIEPLTMEVLQSIASDHQPLLGVFRFRASSRK